MKKTFYIFSIIFASAAASCTLVDDAEYASADELGAPVSSYTVTAEQGTLPFKVYTNKSGEAVVMEDARTWLAIADPKFEQDKTLVAEYRANDGYPRTGKILLVTETRKDTVYVYQEGKPESFNFTNTAAVVYNGPQGEVEHITEIPAELSMPLREVDFEVAYIDQSTGWITEYGLNRTKLWIKTQNNPDSSALRHATITLKWTDGWEKLHTESISVTQANARNLLGNPITFKELRDMATVDGTDIMDEVYIECQVVGDLTNKQNGSCDMQDILTGTFDAASNDLTNYVQSLDGRYGVRITTFAPADNIFRRGTQASILLKGAKIAKTEDEPVRYHLTDVKAEMLMEAKETQIVVKEKYIDELVDDDIYTYVTLKDCEIPVRKGPFTPINEGYGPNFKYNFTTKYPMIIHDKEGGSMYMMTNMSCPYRRDGRAMPAGSGTISGIIVHEYFRPFVDADNAVEKYCGDIGRYQIRHLFREDIALAEDFKDSFSGLITEFRYLKQPADPAATELPKAMLATAGNGCMTHTYDGYTSILGLRTTNFSQSFFYLGPCSSSHKLEYKNGSGIIEEDGSDYAVTAIEKAGTQASQNTDGKGGFAANLYISWANKYWWDSADNRGYCWLVKCSTAGIESDHVSMQFAMYNNGQSNALNTKAPRYWKAEYSLTTSNCSKAYDGEWTLIGNFTVPDVMTWATQQYSQSIATKTFNFELPVEVLGKDNLYIRLMPRNNKACSHSATDYYYDASAIANNSGCNTMDYFAIRYNK